MTIKILPVIIGLSVSVAATSTFASAFNEDEELQRVLEASLHDYHHVDNDVDFAALALQRAHDEEEKKRLALEEEEFEKALALSMNDTVGGGSSSGINLGEQEELARQFSEALAFSLSNLTVEEEKKPRSLIEQQNLEYQVALLTDQLKETNRKVVALEEQLVAVAEEIGEKELALKLESLRSTAENLRAHATSNEKRFGSKNPRLEKDASEAEAALEIAEKELRLFVEAKADKKLNLEGDLEELVRLVEEQKLALAEAIKAAQ